MTTTGGGNCTDDRYNISSVFHRNDRSRGRSDQGAHLTKTSSVLLLGATGLVGSECLRLLLSDPHYERVVVLTRRPLPTVQRTATGAGKLMEQVIDFDEIALHAQLTQVDQVICALGTTIRKAGSRERFRQVDFGYPLEIARLANERGASHFLLVSAIGANAGSRFFYNRVKGELEVAVTALPYRSVTIVRPSLLVGKREELRLGEWIAERFSFLVPRSYKPVEASAVAAALIQEGREDREGTRIIDSDRMLRLAHQYRVASET
ncbi:oxidoreductase [soil metagenome]